MKLFSKNRGQKTKIQKTYESWKSRGYVGKPKVSFIIQCHNKSEESIKIVDRLRDYQESEILILDDGSNWSHSERLINHMNRGNEYVLRFNDLYEVITYSRAITFSRGEFVVLLQDDDDFDGLEWVARAIQYFEQYDDLVILGGRNGVNMLSYDTSEDGKRGPYEMQGEIGQRKNSFKFDLAGTMEVSNELEQFQFVQTVNRAPMWLRRQLFLEKLEDIDQSYAPFHWDDAEICLKANLLGLKVGWYNAKFDIGALGQGGMRIWNSELHNRQDEVNAKKLYDQYGSRLLEIQAKVDEDNRLV